MQQRIPPAGNTVPRPAAPCDLDRVAARYAVAITPAMSELIDNADSHDPIARQFAPDPRELVTTPHENADPIGDHTHEVTPGLVHRYPDRVLLKAVSVCAVYCRFCFRREMVGPGHGAPMSADALTAALDYIRSNKKIWEVIVSGGDPFVMSPRRIAELVTTIETIEHVKILRWHTRVPSVAPERVTPELVAALRSSRLAVWVALHANHPCELTVQARAACARIVEAGIPMISQSVLLKGINDDADTLEALMRAFVEARVKPYYLHHLDQAPGTSHFRTSIARGQAITQDLRGRLSGLAQPTYVLDIPGGHGKIPIGTTYFEVAQSDCYATTYDVTDHNGCRHCYVDPADTSAIPTG